MAAKRARLAGLASAAADRVEVAPQTPRGALEAASAPSVRALCSAYGARARDNTNAPLQFAGPGPPPWGSILAETCVRIMHVSAGPQFR